MAHIGVLPTRTSVNVTSSNGDSGSIPSATTSSAGCMSAEQAKRLDALWAASLTGAGQPLVIEHAPDAVTRSELQAVLATLPRLAALPAPMIDITPLRQQIDDLRHRVETAPAAQSVSDPVVREVMTQALAQMEDMDNRLRRIERVISTLQQVAEVKAAMEAAA